MKIEYRIHANNDFYTEAFKRYRASKRFRHLFSLVKVVGFLFFVFAAWVTISQNEYIYALITVLAALVILFSRQIDYFVLMRNLRKSPHLNEELLCRFDEDGLQIHSDKIDMRATWDIFTEAKRMDDGFLLFQGPKLFNWLPDGALVDRGDLKDMRLLLRKKISTNF